VVRSVNQILNLPEKEGQKEKKKKRKRRHRPRRQTSIAIYFTHFLSHNGEITNRLDESALMLRICGWSASRDGATLGTAPATNLDPGDFKCSAQKFKPYSKSYSLVEFITPQTNLMAEERGEG
jgi:hypothetical protein